MNHSFPFNIEAARAHFRENFVSRGELGASGSVWKEGAEILSLAGGYQDREQTVPWLPSTPVLVWSATKGVSSACVLHALENSRVSLHSPVEYLWPEFGAAGKESVSIRMLLQHQAGVCALDNPPPVDDREAVVAALAAQPPAWEIGSGHGYHPRTFGFLLDELVRRAVGVPLGSYWRSVFGEPLSLEFWIGLPVEMVDQVAPVHAPRGTLAKGDPFLTAFMTPGSLTSRSFASPRGLHTAGAMNEASARLASYPGWGGVGTASALAKFYSMLASDGCCGGKRYFSSEMLGEILLSGVQGPDKVLHIETSFSLGFMRDPVEPNGTKMRRVFGPFKKAFGHPGAGGSVAFAVPDTGLGVAYVMNQMEPGVLPNAKASGLWEALFETSE